MAFISLLERDNSNSTRTATSANLGPGAYTAPTVMRNADVERRKLIGKAPPGFNSGSSQHASNDITKFTPGPGFYNNNKGASTFNKEYISPQNSGAPGA
jgi:hypothetical protein